MDNQEKNEMDGDIISTKKIDKEVFRNRDSDEDKQDQEIDRDEILQK